ncbi:coatomer subunit alpha-2 isoform X2 [Tripterygium wilfordii]|uniref:coatomer subunit alpha-2 isoform X2 n=1 Tax=Tripterygium wilfordii TaxID=458696 RepID=UPI0018F8199B|nr:coatomer subunit alpha-2 isoform X2 [Tripterygium wilfordii]
MGLFVAFIFTNLSHYLCLEERVKILENVGHLPLAYAAAKLHGLQDAAERLAAELGDDIPSLADKVSSLLMPPTPIICGGDWPILRVMKGIFEGGLDSIGKGAAEEEEEATNGGDWGEDLDMVDDDGLENGDVSAILEDGEGAEDSGEDEGWDVGVIDLPLEADTPRASINAHSSVFAPLTLGLPVSHSWIQRSSLAAEHAAAENFDTAMRLLSRQLGIRNFSPLKSMFLDLHTGSQTYLRAFTSAPVISLAVERGWNDLASPNVRTLPALVSRFSQLEEKLKLGYKATTAGKLTEGLRFFISILHTIPLIVVESRREVDEVKELIIIVKEYVLGLKMELKRRELKDDLVRQQELAAYFTHCNLQMHHLRLALLIAMSSCAKAKNFATAANFAPRLIETNPTIESQAKTARQVLQAAEKNMTDASQINYDFRNPFVTCGALTVLRGLCHTRKGSCALFVSL